MQSLTVHNLYVGEGSDFTGVVTKMLTINGSLHINVYNPATFFGIHVYSSPINLLFSDITVASGQVSNTHSTDSGLVRSIIVKMTFILNVFEVEVKHNYFDMFGYALWEKSLIRHILKS